MAGGKLNSASTLIAAVAKTIELSFIAVFIGFLGQYLSRNALDKGSKGISIADMQLRTLILQPATLFTHWHGFHFGGRILLGCVSLVACVSAMLFTTASDTLVSPKLVLGDYVPRQLEYSFRTAFANSKYVFQRCPSPIPVQEDPDNAQTTCIEIELSGQAYHDYMQWLGIWNQSISSKNGSTDESSRPRPVAMLSDNITVTGTWLQGSDMQATSQKYGRTINNVTMVMPHAGVYAAARLPQNDISQAQDIEGAGELFLNATVLSPAVHVTCASLTKDELAPLVYEEWPNTDLDASQWQNQSNQIPVDWINRTAVDSVFGFNRQRPPPIFPKVPHPYNTVLNSSGNYPDALYLLAAAPNQGAWNDSKYVMCSMSATLEPGCSTIFHYTSSGGDMRTDCDVDNGMAYQSGSEPGRYNDWVTIANLWATATSLSTGINDANASNARLLTQLIPTTDNLDPQQPSLAEALAVLSGYTLLVSALETPFDEQAIEIAANAPNRMLADPMQSTFQVQLRVSDYASGATIPWQNVFFLVLLPVFILNIFCLGYFTYLTRMKKNVPDFIEPQSLFVLALKSPPNRNMVGAYDGKLQREQVTMKWHIWKDSNQQPYVTGGVQAARYTPINIPDIDYEDPDTGGLHTSPGWSHLGRRIKLFKGNHKP